MTQSDMGEIEKDVLVKRLKWYSDRYGPHIEKRGLHNWKNLFGKPTLQDLLIMFMIIMMGFVAWAYQADTSTCRETMGNIEGICIDYCAGKQLELESKFEQDSNTTHLDWGSFEDIIVKAEANNNAT